MNDSQGNKVQVGDFVNFTSGPAEYVNENCLVIDLDSKKNIFFLRTIEALDGNAHIRYFNSAFVSVKEETTLITDKDIVSRLQKLIIFQ